MENYLKKSLENLLTLLNIFDIMNITNKERMNQMNEQEIYDKAVQMVKDAGVDEDDYGEWIEAMEYAVEDIKKGGK